VNLAPSLYKTEKIIFFFYCGKNHGKAAGRGEYDTHTNGVWFEAFTVENLRGKKTCRHFCDNDIEVGL
jgi:hypothetical protein